MGSNFGVFDDFSDFDFLLVNADAPPGVGGCPAKTTDLSPMDQGMPQGVAVAWKCRVVPANKMLETRHFTVKSWSLLRNLL